MQRRTASNARSRGSDPPAHAGGSIPDLNRRNDPQMLPRRNNSKPNVFGKYYEQHSGLAQQTVHDFFHDRTGVQGCFLAGIIRFCYASLYLYSILMMTLQMRMLFDPRKGLMPYSITGQDVGDYNYSIFEFAPQSSLVVYAMFLLGISSGVLLLLGIEPRWGAAGAFFVLQNLQSHNTKIFDDHEFHMNKMWAFFLVFLPLDHFTIRDDFGGIVPLVRGYLNLPTTQPPRRQKPRNNLSTSWPMWPFRLWQVYTCMIYMGAGLSKLNTSPWIQGNALSWFWYDETIGRFYPAFVIELFYNRLITIKLQTWLFLLIENICVITIWPKRTRKVTFAAVVLMHIGMEFALVMHIFEYLLVLGWVCFFVYPNDGNSNSEEGLIKNKKNDGAKWTPAAIFGSNRGKTIETVVAVSLLYLLTYDIFPREEVEKLMPTPLAYLVWKLVYPPGFINTKLDALVHLLGIHANPYVLDDEGLPEHMQSRMTAVIRFNDGREPILHQDAEWATSSFVKREIDYWYDTYTYYLMEEVASPADIPYYGALSVHLAELYGNGGIDRWYDTITIEPDNTVESVSIQVHKRTGSELPAPPDWSLFASIPREWRYQTVCQFVFTPNRVQSDDEKYFFPMNGLWDGPEYQGRNIKNGCVNYNTADEALHRKGQYGEPDIPNDDNGDDDEDEDEAAGNDGFRRDYGEEQYRRPIDRENDEEENRSYGENNVDDDGTVSGGPNGDASEEEDKGDESNEEARFGEGEYRPPINGEESDDEENRGNEENDGNDGEVPNRDVGGEDDGDEGGDKGGDESEDEGGDESEDEGGDESEEGTQGSGGSDDQNHRRLRARR